MDFRIKAMDRHALQSKARDDGKTPKEAEMVFFNHARRWKDFEIRIGALQGERGDKPRWLSHKRAEAIHDSSPKANAKTKGGKL